MDKVAWILPGGAARTVYTAGVLFALGTKKFPRPDMIIACSGSAGTSLCYVAEQYDLIKNIWCNGLFTKKFINYWRFWKMIDIDYLIDTLMKKHNPIDMDKVKKSPIEVLIPLTNSQTGKITYYSSRDDVDLWEVIRAAKSVPFFTNLFSPKGNKVEGVYYSDSIATTRFSLHVEKAIREGATKIFIFDSWHEDDNPGGYFFSVVYARVKNEQFRKTQLNYIKKIKLFKLPETVPCVLLRPQQPLGMVPWSSDKKRAMAAFNRGQKDILKHKDVFS